MHIGGYLSLMKHSYEVANRFIEDARLQSISPEPPVRAREFRRVHPEQGHNSNQRVMRPRLDAMDYDLSAHRSESASRAIPITTQSPGGHRHGIRDSWVRGSR